MNSEQILSLAQYIVTWLSPFFPYLIKSVKLAGAKWFEALGEKGGEEAVKRAVSLWDTIMKKSSDNRSVEGAAMLLSENPENPEVQQLLAKALTEVFQKHPELLLEMDAFRKSAPSITIDQRSGGVYFSGAVKTDIKGDVIGHDQTNIEK
jgi:hypothetical protein